jgi:hypothetical protein
LLPSMIKQNLYIVGDVMPIYLLALSTTGHSHSLGTVHAADF